MRGESFEDSVGGLGALVTGGGDLDGTTAA